MSSIWDKLKAKSQQQELEDMLDELEQSTSGGSSMAQPVQQGSGSLVLPQGAGQSTLAGHSTQSLSQVLSGLSFGGLSKQEQEELEILKKDHQNETKKQKLVQFKKLAPEMRQFVINALTWHEEVQLMNNLVIDRPQRLIELEQKEQAGKIFMTGQSMSSQWSTLYGGTDMFGGMLRTIGLPDGVTAENLKEAHIEASLEEEILNGEKET